MKIIKTVNELTDEIESFRINNPSKKIGFVPTMGALHNGHLSLIDKVKDVADLVVCSVFVNPTQFNNSDDLLKYPRTVDADVALLEQNECDILFLPSEKEIYPNNSKGYHIDLNGLDKVMEGKFRDNHFEGVCMVVERLLKIVTPDYAAFGLKDFQQVAVLKHMIKVKNLEVELIECPILRESNGLAMSSRNMRLSEQQKQDATIIYKTLKLGKAEFEKGSELETIKTKMLNLFQQGNLRLEYLEIVDNLTLKSVVEIKDNLSCCIAAYCGEVRLIDNIQF